MAVVASAFAAHCASFDEFSDLIASAPGRLAEMESYERALTVPGQFAVPGYCVICERSVEFLVDYRASCTTWSGAPVPNWREVVACPRCFLNNRMRASLGYLLDNSAPGDVVYVTEATTPLYTALRGRRPHAVGSEFLGTDVALGAINEEGIRHEDSTRLTFADGAFDVIGSFDVLEHVPGYARATAELFRCLRSGGRLALTVPLCLSAQETVTRATVDDTGNVSHLLEPEIHDNPLDAGGSLCFYNYGWDFIDQLRRVGFEDAGVSLYWNPVFGYLGGYQAIITGNKPPD